jgi:quercetin dioxygenase-like cupin family protein
MKILFQICTIMITTFFLLQQATAQDPVRQSPDEYKVLVNNDKVRVLDVRLKPSDKSPMHSHPDRVSYILSGSTVKITPKDGKATEAKTKAGQCVWHKAESHAVENTGKTEVHVIEMELKR